MKLMLINKDNPLPKDYKPELQEVCEGYFMEAHAACSYEKNALRRIKGRNSASCVFSLQKYIIPKGTV